MGAFSKPKLACLVCLVCLAPLLACEGSQNPLGPSAPVNRPIASYAGTWSGETADGDAVSFVVSHENGALFLESIHAEVRLTEIVPSATPCFPLSGQSPVTFEYDTGHFPFDELSIDYQPPPFFQSLVGEISFNGRLRSDLNASGHLKAEQPAIGVGITFCGARGETDWTASLD